MDWQHQKSPAPGALRHHGDKAGVDRAAVAVVDGAGDGDAAVAVLPGGRRPQHRVAPRWTERHWRTSPSTETVGQSVLFLYFKAG